MADKRELKRMVATFHIPELHILLEILKQNKNGRKSELIDRILSIMSGGVISRHVQDVIKQLYRQRSNLVGYSNHLQTMDKFVTNNPTTSNRAVRKPESSTSDPSRNIYHHDVDEVCNAGTNNMKDKPKLVSMASAPASSKQLPVHPDVRLKPLPFYQHIGVLLKTATLIRNSSEKMQESGFSFHMTSKDVAQLASLASTSSRTNPVQIQLRFCHLDPSCEQDDNFPKNLDLKVNGKPFPLPPYIPSNKPGVEPKRPPRSLDITPFCKLSCLAPNHINVSWAADPIKNYCVSINLVLQLTAESLLRKLKDTKLRDASLTRTLIKKKLAQDNDTEISTTSLRISLCCPLGKMRITVPCRAGTCNHIQCFDAITYLTMNEKKPTWMCPICDRPADFNQLIIDGLFTEILQKSPNANEIHFNETGAWEPVNQSEEQCWVSDSPQKKVEEDVATNNAEELIDLTESDDEMNATPFLPNASSNFSHVDRNHVSTLVVDRENPTASRNTHSYRPAHSSLLSFQTTVNYSSNTRSSSQPLHAYRPMQPPPFAAHTSHQQLPTAVQGVRRPPPAHSKVPLPLMSCTVSRAAHSNFRQQLDYSDDALANKYRFTSRDYTDFL